MANQSYTVVREIIIDGKPALAGSTVELDPDVAAPMLVTGELAYPTAAPAPPELAPEAGTTEPVYRVLRSIIIDGEPAFEGATVSLDAGTAPVLLAMGAVELV